MNIIHPDETYQMDSIRLQEVTNHQSKLGELALLKVFLHKEWTQILNEHWTPAPPRPDGKIVHQKDALEQTVSPVCVIWNIFEAQWKYDKNEILHGDNSKTIESDINNKTNRLLEFRNGKST